MGSALYSWEKCHFALLTLAAGTGTLRERLASAWWNNLNLLTGHPIPWPDLAEKFDSISLRLMTEISTTEHPRLTEDELRDHAKEIVVLCDHVFQRYALDPDATEHTVRLARET